jgi:hypothetical protein
LKHLAYVNADSSEPDYAFHLSGFDVGQADSTGERIVASGWTASNCTSNWNGKRIRIDRLRDSSVEQVFARDLDARSQYPGEDVAARIEGDTVTFLYEGATGDGDLLSGPAIARYQIVAGRVVHVSPVALTRAGFIYEWLRMTDAEAVRWSEPAATGARNSVAAVLAKDAFDWQRIAQCGGSSPIWEIAIRPDKVKTLIVFRMSGERASELRMLAIGDTTSPSCKPEDISKSLSRIAAKLPQ